MAAIPRTPNWKLSEIPTYFNQGQIQKILDAFNRSTAEGKRDYAMARLLIDLGLRCSEVTNIALRDIDWREGVIRITAGKTRQDKLPLPHFSGEAIMDYLRHGRPKTASSLLFVHHRAPYGQRVYSETVRGVVRRAYQRAGLKGFTGTHVLRRSLATHMLQAGTPLKEIADILRHKSINTSMIYAKVNLPQLQRVTLPWIGE